MNRPSFIIASALFALIASSAPLFAQGGEIDELRAAVREMQKTIAEQNVRMAEQSKRIATLEKQQSKQQGKSDMKPASSSRLVTVAGTNVPVGDLPTKAMPSARTPVRDENTFLDLQQGAPRVNNAPLDPDLKAFIAIPGTETMFKIGGAARLDAIVDFGNNGNPNQFVPSTIPVRGEPGWDGGQRSTLHTKGTRLSLELRRPVPWNSTLRIYTEYDFFDEPFSNMMKFRVRHFYGQAWNLLIGQTYSAFMDIDAFPDVVNYQGPNGIVNRRQPQIRYTLPIYEGVGKMQLFASIEQPESRIDTSTDEFEEGAMTLSHVPDGVIGARWEGKLGHIHGAALFRELSFETDNGPSEDTFGWGVTMAGALNLGKDKLSAQVTYGDGVARYINDLSGEDLDAALDGGRLEAIPVFAAMAGYTHHWSEQWRTTIAGGYVHADPPASLGRFAIDNTIYGSVNLMWHPTTSFRMGFEYLYGSKETIDGSERDAHRINFVLRYDLVR